MRAVFDVTTQEANEPFIWKHPGAWSRAPCSHAIDNVKQQMVNDCELGVREDELEQTQKLDHRQLQIVEISHVNLTSCHFRQTLAKPEKNVQHGRVEAATHAITGQDGHEQKPIVRSHPT